MKIKLDYPINGHDLSLHIVRSPSDLMCVSAKLKRLEVFRYDGNHHGLLSNTQIADEIIHISKTILNDQI